MKIFFFLSLIFLGIHVFGQSFSPAIQSLINSENGFAASSKKENTREAFLRYLSDSTVLFNTKSPAKGKGTWLNRKPDSSLLFWWPLFVGVSEAGDLGFSTGPWQWSRDRRNAQPLAYGQFASVWQKGSDGAWKLAADLGISFSGQESNLHSLEVSKITPNQKEHPDETSATSFLDRDKEYIAHLNKKSLPFLAEYFADDARLLRNGRWPLVNPATFDTILNKQESYQFEQTGGALSFSADLGYTYGIVTKQTISGDKSFSTRACFLRVWKKEGRQWKIVLDVIGEN